MRQVHSIFIIRQTRADRTRDCGLRCGTVIVLYSLLNLGRINCCAPRILNLCETEFQN